MRQLAAGGTIGIVNPAYIPVEGRMERGIEYLRARGYRVKKARNTEKKFGYFAGSDAQRISDLHDMYFDTEVDLILCGRGGWGALRLVDGIDYDLIRRQPKCLVGYSDITTLQLAIWRKCGIASLSGPMACVEMATGIDPLTETHFWDLVSQTGRGNTIDLGASGTAVIAKGKAEGPLLGGCLAMVTNLLGTPYSPDYSGSVLFLEDVGEKPYKIDRALAQLKQAGVLESINGLILGEFVDCEADPGEVSFSLPQLFEQYFADMPYPVVSGFPYGHGPRKYTMPVGAAVKLDTDERSLQLGNIFT